MVAVTYGTAPVEAGTPERAVVRKTWFARLLDAMMESRMRQAQRELARYAHLLPYSLDNRDVRLIKSGKDQMPFGGW
jgi:hypothetical protein